MSKYTIEITETLQRAILIEAESEEVALEKVRTMYENEEVVLDSDDFVGTVIEITESK